MMHVEVWLGDGPKTIGARWNNGKVQVFDSYRFNPKSFTNEQYLFRSIDTWLMGICKRCVTCGGVGMGVDVDVCGCVDTCLRWARAYVCV